MSIKRLVITPTYNENQNIGNLIDEISALPTPFDILVIDDNSDDGTAATVREISSKYPNALSYQPESIL